MTRILLALVTVATVQAKAEVIGSFIAHLPKVEKELRLQGEKYLTIDSEKTEIVDLTEQYASHADETFLIKNTETFANTQCDQSSAKLFSQPLISSTDAGSAADWLTELGQVELVLDKVINIGKKVWDVVAKGKPVVNIQTDVATALPAGAKCWLDLQGWARPQSKVWGISFKNLYGVEVVKLVYRVLYLPGGSVDGQGRYIGYATIQPVEVNVAWGYTFNAKVTIPTVFNMGSKASPIAGMNITMSWTIDTILKHTEQSQSFFVSGLGEFRQLD